MNLLRRAMEILGLGTAKPTGKKGRTASRRLRTLRQARNRHLLFERCEDRSMLSTVSASAMNSTVTEGSVAAVFFTASSPSMTPMTINWQTVAGSATANSDYQGASGSAFLMPGQTFTSVGVSTLTDFTVESPETFSVVITSVTGGTVGGASAVITITDATPSSPPAAVVSVAAGSNHVSEGNAATFTLSVSPPQMTAVTVSYQTVAGTAIQNTDYEAKSGTATIPSGQSSVSVSVPTYHDFSSDPGETFSLQATAATGASVSTTQNTAPVIIDDVPFVLPTITVGNGSVEEGDAYTPLIEVDTGTAGSSYILTVNWGDGTQATYGTNDTPIHTYFDDPSTTTPTESYTLTVTAEWAAGQVATGSGTVTVNMTPDEYVTWSIATSSAMEPEDGIENMLVTVSLSSPLSDALTFGYATSDSSASAIFDYVAASGSLVFAAGETQKTFNVGIQSDWITEPSESFTITATPSGSPPPNVFLLPSGAQALECVIHDNGNWLGIPFGVLDGSDWEADEAQVNPGRVPFVVELDELATRDIEFSYFLATGDAGVDQDFDADGGNITILAGQLTGTIWIDVLDESIPEGDENFWIYVTQVGTPLPSIPAEGIIFDDDLGELGPLSGSVMILNAPLVQEPSSSSDNVATYAHFIVAYTNPSGLNATVEWYTESPNSGDATAGVDYFVASGTLTLPPSSNASLFAEFAVKIKYDTNYPEPDEPFSVKLRNPIGIAIGKGGEEARGTIKDQPDPTTLPIEYTIYAVYPQADEAGQVPAGFTVMRTGPINLADEVFLTLDGSAGHLDYNLTTMIGGPISDYGGVASVTIPANSSAVSFLAIPMTDIITPEPDETIIVTIRDEQPRGNPFSATAIIKDAGSRVTIVNNSPGHKTPENDARRESFTVSRWGSTSGDLWVNLSHGGTATVGNDFRYGSAGNSQHLPGPVKIPNGAMSVDIVAQLIDDWKVEDPDETVVVAIAAGTGYTIDSPQGSATLTIVDDDVTPVVSITPASSTVNEWGGTSVNLTLSRTGPTIFSLPVPLNFSGNAVKEADYRLFKVIGSTETAVSSHTSSFEPGQGSFTLRLKPIDDQFMEPVGLTTENGEDAVITIVATNRLIPATSQDTATIRIVDNELPGAGWEIVRVLQQRDPIYTDWEWKNIGGGRSNQWGWERHKLVPEWQDKASYDVPVSVGDRSVNVGGSVSTSHTRTWNFGGSVTATGGGQSWLNVGGTVSGALEHQWTVSGEVGASEAIDVPALAEVTVTDSILRLSNIVQRVRGGDGSPPPTGVAGEQSVNEESGGRFWYTEYFVTWTYDFVFVESGYWVKMKRN